MLQEIHPHQYDIAYRRRAPRDGDAVTILRDDGAVLVADLPDGGLPTLGELRSAFSENAAEPAYLFSLDDTAYFYGDNALPEGNGFRYRDIQYFRELQPAWRAFAGITACHLGQWYRKNRFCGRCGARMERDPDERALRCPACGLVAYPAIAPAVIVALMDGDRLLMTRYANRNQRRAALVAGYVEVGETLEDTVRREVMEEVGLKVKNIRYYKSQPWAFSGSLLVGFFADLDGSPRVTLDTNELQEAVWVERRDIPAPESVIALTSEMVELFRRGEEPGAQENNN